MKLIQLFNILVFLCMVYGANIKPENWDELEYIQISNKNDKKSRYYKLDRKSEIVFDNLDRILKKDKNYIIKIMTRTPISKNSNSNKTFGFNLDIQESGKVKVDDVLKYKKRISKYVKPEKGMYFTDAGYWVEEIFSPKNLKIKIKSLKNSPAVYLKISYEEIAPLESRKTILPISQKPYETLYISYKSDSTKKSIKWYDIDQNKVQYKIKGPSKVKVRTRALIDTLNQSYKLRVYEDGYKKSTYEYNIKKPKNTVYYLDGDNNKVLLSKQDYFLINVPKGEHYYSFKNSSTKMYIKLESISLD